MAEKVGRRENLPSYGTMEIVLIQKEVAMLGWILCIYGIIFMIFIIFSTKRLWKEISKIWGDKN